LKIKNSRQMLEGLEKFKLFIPVQMQGEYDILIDALCSLSFYEGAKAFKEHLEKKVI
jgi:hypothetical protein